MRQTVRGCLLVGVFWSLALPFWGLEVPLKYEKLPKRNIEFKIASVKVADFDMLGSQAKPPVFQIDLASSDTVRGLIRADSDGTTSALAEGRECRSGRYASFKVDDPTSACSKGELYVLVDYFDSAPDTGTLLQLTYDSKQGALFDSSTKAEPVHLTNSNTWKRHQFRLPNAYFGTQFMDFSFSMSNENAMPVYGSQSPKKLLSLPVGRWKLPPGANQPAPVTTSPDGWTVVSEKSAAPFRQPFYALAKIGEKERLMMLGYQSPDSAFYDRLYFDANGNGDLTDDKVVDAKASVTTGSRSINFDPIDTTIEIGGETLPYSFYVQLYSYYGDERSFSLREFEYQVQLSLNTNCYYRGEFEAEGKRYAVAVSDSDCNGKFGDMLSGRDNSYYYVGGTRVPYVTGDSFYLTPKSEKLASDGSQVIGDRLLLEKSMFDVAVDSAAGKLSLTPTTETLVSVSLPTPTKSMELYTSDQKHAVMVYDPPEKQIQLPEGDYLVKEYTILRKDAQGDLWRLKARGSANATSVTAAIKDCALAYGEPFTPVVDVDQWARQQIRDGQTKSASLSLRVEGVGKDVVSECTHLSGTLTKCELSPKQPSRPKEPLFRIAKTDGEIVAQGCFEYG